jgi:urea-proton symporter
MPYVAYTIMRKGGVVAVLLMLFQAITNAMSSGASYDVNSGFNLLMQFFPEVVAVTSLATYDFYRSYVNPSATGKQLFLVSHIAVVGFGLITATIAVGLVYAGTSVSFIVTAVGIIIDGKSVNIGGSSQILRPPSVAVIPSAYTLLWRKQSRQAVSLVPLFSSIASIST